MAPANKGNPTNELLLAASALRNRSCIAGDSLPSLTLEMFLPGSWTLVLEYIPRRGERGTYGHIPFTSVWGTFLVVEGDSINMGEKTVVSICQ